VQHVESWDLVHLSVGRSTPPAARSKLRGAAIGLELEIGNGKGRGIVHCGEHHPIANGIELQVQSTDIAAVQAPRLGCALMAVNFNTARGTLPLHSGRCIGTGTAAAGRWRRLCAGVCSERRGVATERGANLGRHGRGKRLMPDQVVHPRASRASAMPSDLGWSRRSVWTGPVFWRALRANCSSVAETMQQITPARAVERVDRGAELTHLLSHLVKSSSDGLGTRDVAKPSSALKSGSRAPHITTRSIRNARARVHVTNYRTATSSCGEATTVGGVFISVAGRSMR
jgi:hypothetical protein